MSSGVITGFFYSTTHKVLRRFFSNTVQKMKFPLRISSVNVTKSAETTDLVTFAEEILNGKLHFLCSEIRVFVTPVASSSLRHFKKFLSVLEIF